MSRQLERAPLSVAAMLNVMAVAIFVTPSLAEASETPRQPGQPFDAGPFAVNVLEEPGKAYGVIWAEWRKVRAAEVEFDPAATVPPADDLKIEYWHRHWNGLPDPILAEADIARTGWTPVDDWTNGQWKTADTRMTQQGSCCRWTFAPTHEKEFPDLGRPGVTFRKTFKIRLVAKDHLPPVKAFRVFTDSVYKPLTVRIHWGTPAVEHFRYEGENPGKIEVFNGYLQTIRAVGQRRPLVADDQRFTLPAGIQGILELDLLVAANDENYDRPIVTVRTTHNPFSFSANEVAQGQRILVNDFGVLVTRGDDPMDLETYRERLREFPGRTVYDRVFAQPEQTLSRAWNEMPIKRPLYFVHGLPGNRNLMSQAPNGDISVSNVGRWFRISPSPIDSQRKIWKGDWLRMTFGFPPENYRAGRELLEGYLPVLKTWWVDGNVYYEQQTVLTLLHGEWDTIRLDDPTVLFMQIRVVNLSGNQPATASLVISSYTEGREELVFEEGRVSAVEADRRLLRCIFDSHGQGSIAAEEGRILWSCELPPGTAQKIHVAIPSITLTEEEEIAALIRRSFDEEVKKAISFWRELANNTTQIQTPEPWLNHFYRAVLFHNEINCTRDIAAPRRYARVGSLRYGVFPNESIMMTADLDRRGQHQTVRECLQTFLDFQGTVPLPGNFQSTDGLFYGANGYESGGYNKHHGYVMWGMADHWFITRDREWMAQAASKLVKACDWVTRERQATMRLNPDGSRPLEYGFLPAGGLEDVQDYWYWLATNVNTAWGFSALAAALADFGHPEAPRILRDAEAYRQDVLRSLTEARIRTPVVRLRDGTYVPKYPSHLHLRGRALGWIRETLEGAIFLPAHRLIDPIAPETVWILKDYEDNLYISDAYGYSIPVFERFWFSRGGFSMQANLLDGPMPYLYRDEIKHFLRAYFNGFASAFYPEIMMCNEHSSPELGYPAGDHFKTSDESNVTFWLRLMLIREDGENLYLGQAVPRYWLADGEKVSIERAPTYFGPMSVSYVSEVRQGRIRVELCPPERNPPRTIYLRIRHPEEKPIRRVEVNGQPYTEFDPAREWVILAGKLEGSQNIVVYY